MIQYINNISNPPGDCIKNDIQFKYVIWDKLKIPVDLKKVYSLHLNIIIMQLTTQTQSGFWR